MSSSPGGFEGKYEVLGKIREGGMGAIYMVRHRLLDEIRIIKVMRAEVAESADQRKRFLREAQTATRLKHANIVGFYDFFVDDEGTAFMVMEYIDGINLRDMVRNCGPLPIPLAVYLARQCLSALDYLHRKGIVHRDISPDNIMMQQEEDGTLQAKLIDLGIAKLARVEDQEQLTAANEFIGKLRYSSPEQLTNKANSNRIDGRSDLFSFAVVLYESLTGVCPYGGGSLQEILKSRLDRPPLAFSESDRNGRVPVLLRGVILKGLQKSPAERWQNALEFTKAIDSIPPADAAARDPEEVSNYVRGAIEFARKAAAAQNPASASLQKTLQSKFRISEVSIRPLEATDMHIQKTLAKWGAEATPSGSVRPDSGSTPFSQAQEKTVPSGPVTLPPPPASRSSIAGYAAVALGAAVLVVLGIVLSSWMRGRPDIGPVVQTPPKPIAVATVVAAPTSAVPPTGASVAVVPTSVPTGLPATPLPVAPSPAPSVVERPSREPYSGGAGPGENRRLARLREARPSTEMARPAAAVGVPANRPKQRFCPEVDRTSFEPGVVKDVPSGFRDSAPIAMREDFPLFQIQIAVNPGEPLEGQEFTVVARFRNGSENTLRFARAEQSSPGARGGYEPIPGLAPQPVDAGGVLEIWRRTLAVGQGETFRKSFRVVEQKRGDVWKASVFIRPCVEN